MRKFGPNCSVSYSFHSKDKVINEIKNNSCFSKIATIQEAYDSILITNLNCTETIGFKDFYLNYIGEMLGLDYIIIDNGFKFKSLNSKKANLLVCTLVRMLWEGPQNSLEKYIQLFTELRDRNTRIKKKFKRFCFIYSKLETDGYFANGHSICITNKCKLRTLEDFKKWVRKVETYPSINKFFTGE
tara:strand:- start:57654 stop:58211 length:558 start_codon:yes stop_codon:yes gene_type:complete